MRNRVRFPNLILYISIEGPKRDEGYCHISGWLNNRDDTLMWLHDKKGGGHFRGVYFRAQGDTGHFRREDGRIPMYGYDIQWNDSQEHAHLRNLQLGVAALSGIERGLSRVTEQAGAPATFGDWVRRLATVIGVGGVRISGGEIVSPAEAAERINAQVAAWQARARGEASADVA